MGAGDDAADVGRAEGPPDPGGQRHGEHEQTAGAQRPRRLRERLVDVGGVAAAGVDAHDDVERPGVDLEEVVAGPGVVRPRSTGANPQTAATG